MHKRTLVTEIPIVCKVAQQRKLPFFYEQEAPTGAGPYLGPGPFRAIPVGSL